MDESLFDTTECRQVANQMKMGGGNPLNTLQKAELSDKRELIRELGNWIWRILLQSCQFKSSAVKL